MVCKSTKVFGAIGALVVILGAVALVMTYQADTMVFDRDEVSLGETQTQVLNYVIIAFVIALILYVALLAILMSKEKKYKKKYEDQKELADYHSNKLGFNMIFGIGLLVTLFGIIAVVMIYMADDLGLVKMVTGKEGAEGIGELQQQVLNYASIGLVIWLILYVVGVLAARPKKLPSGIEAAPEIKPIEEEMEEELVLCPECGAEVAEDAEECPNCGASFIEEVCECPACGMEISCDVNICPECGAEFEEEEEEIEEEAFEEEIEEPLEEEETAEEELAEVCECPECGAEIPCDAPSCPECGVEFEEEEEEIVEEEFEPELEEIEEEAFEEELEEEEELAELCECPECGADIDCEASSCPNCGVEFEE